MIIMIAVPFTSLPTGDPTMSRGIPPSVPSPEEYLQKLSAKEFKPIQLPNQPVTSEGELSLIAIGSHIPVWKFECALDVSDETIKASGHSRDIEFSFEIKRQPLGNQVLPGYHFHFGLLPNSTADAALWFSEFFYAMIVEGRLIHLRLGSKDTQFLLSLQLPTEVHVDPLFAQELGERIEFFRELLAIGAALDIPFRIPERTLQERVITHRVFQAISHGLWADCDTYICDDSEARFANVINREVDVIITEKDSIVQLLGYQLHLGPVTFIAPSAFIHSLEPSQVEGNLRVEIDYRKFGGCAYFLNYMRPVPGVSLEELSRQQNILSKKLSEQAENVKIEFWEPGTLVNLEEDSWWALKLAKREQARREAYQKRSLREAESNLAEISQRSAERRSFEQECAFVSGKENAARYTGQWVALDGDQVVAVGRHPVEVVAEAERKGVIDPVVHYFPARDPDMVYWGGWQ
ncbi:MAG: hypothetical protein HY314_11240 [Acidobacteria bacterium]|nr:hypothetical protein [Acidobacteriota bacterium]